MLVLELLLLERMVSLNKCPHKFIPKVFHEITPLDIVLNIKQFDSAFTWIEKQTLIGYFVGHNHFESMLWNWVSKV